MQIRDPDGPSITSVKKASLLSSSILLLTSSDKIGNQVDFLGLSIAGEGHKLFVALVLVVLLYYSANYFILTFHAFHFRKGADFSESRILTTQITSALQKVNSAISKLREQYIRTDRDPKGRKELEKYDTDRNLSSKADEIVNLLEQSLDQISKSRSHLLHLHHIENRRFAVFEILFPLALVLTSILHGFGEYLPLFPTVFD